MSSTPAIAFCGPDRCFEKLSRPTFYAAFGILRQLHRILVTVLVLAGIGVPAFSQGPQAKDDSTLAAPRVQPPAVPTEDCNGNGNPGENPHHILPAGNQETDLKIEGITCVVDGSATIDGVPGSYVYRNVNILKNGTLRFNDALIDFHAHSILVEMAGTLEAGAGANSAIHGPLTFWLWGTSTDNIPSITCLSDRVNECGVPHDAWVSNPNVPMHQMPTMPCVTGSTKGFPLPNDDCFYQYEVFDAGDIPGAYFGRKVLAVSAGGNLLLRGSKSLREEKIESRPADSGTSWARLIKNLNGQGAETSLYIDRAVPTWGAGDHIVVTTTDYLPSHTEEFVIKDVTSDANGVRINIDISQPAPMNAVQNPHWGQTYDYSSIVEENPGVGPAPDPNLSPDLTGHVETRAIVALFEPEHSHCLGRGHAGDTALARGKPFSGNRRQLLRRTHPGARWLRYLRSSGR